MTRLLLRTAATKRFTKIQITDGFIFLLFRPKLRFEYIPHLGGRSYWIKLVKVRLARTKNLNL